MKRLLSRIFIFIGVLSIVLGGFSGFGNSISFADDLELIGTELGLEIIPPSTKLFDLNRLNPGDTEEAIVTIANNYTAPFQLYLNVERMSAVPGAEDPDLFGQLEIDVYLREVLIYSGSMEGFATSPIYLGQFEPGDMEDLRAVIHLPGPETGNEFQGETLEVRWIFTATSDGPPEDPPVIPEDPPVTPGGPPVVPEPPEEPEEPEIPEEPEDEIIIDVEVPEGSPDVEDEEEIIIQEEIPQGAPMTLPKTGEVSTILYYGVGIAFLALGAGLEIKKKKKD